MPRRRDGPGGLPPVGVPPAAPPPPTRPPHVRPPPGKPTPRPSFVSENAALDFVDIHFEIHNIHENSLGITSFVLVTPRQFLSVGFIIFLETPNQKTKLLPLPGLLCVSWILHLL